MKKFLFLLFAILIIGGTTFALFGGLYPDTPTFPRVPMGDGTIGKLLSRILSTADLANYSSDGTVNNSLALSGVSASGYLKNDANCPGTQKFVAIDGDGKRVCGITSTLLTDYGTVYEQDCPADYYRMDDTQGTTSTGDVMKAGDILKTPPGCTLTIVFADASLLRLDGDTTVSFDLGSLADGTSIASAIISNGSIWGRILTQTGSYNVGTDVIVVGVRGTSILAEKAAAAPVISRMSGSGWQVAPTIGDSKVRIIHSINPTAGSGVCIDSTGNVPFPLALGADVIVPSLSSLNCHTLLLSPVAVTTATSKYTSSTGIANNSVKDLVYMQKAMSGLDFGDKYFRIMNEIMVTKPMTDTEKDAICPDSGMSGSLRLWDSLLGTNEPVCNESALIAFAKYGAMSGVVYTSDSYPFMMPMYGSSFSGANQPHLQYYISNPAMYLSGSWSVIFNVDIVASGSSYQSLFNFSNGPSNILRVIYNSANSNLLVSGSGGSLTGILVATGTQNIRVSYVGSNYKVYFNGSALPTLPSMNSLPPPDSIIVGGGIGVSATLPWIGKIKEFTIRRP